MLTAHSPMAQRLGHAFTRDPAPSDLARPQPADPLDAWSLCTQVQFSAAEQIDASLESLLNGLQRLACAHGVRWRLEDSSLAGRTLDIATRAVGDPQGGGDLGAHTLVLSKTLRPGRTMHFELRLPSAANRMAPVPIDTLVRTLDALGRWLHWLDMSHGPLTAQGPMPLHQRKVLLLMVTGLSEKQIADRLDISTNTAHQYVSTLFRRYGVRNRPSLMARWLGDMAEPEATRVWQARHS